MNIRKSTALYEAWLGRQIRLLPEDLKQKHAAMAEAVFPFFRATFYRWMQVWPDISPECQEAPQVLAVGDLHVENFGTWRDVEGRLVWGINDFDEAYLLPYTLDLVRLAASAHVSLAHASGALERRDACAAVLAGYHAGLECSGRAIVLAEQHGWLRRLCTGELRDPEPFWGKLDELPAVRSVPAAARKAMERMLPKKQLKYTVRHRVAGLGSLGRERYVAMGQYAGGQIAREAKALAASACVWAAGKGPRQVQYQRILDTAVRCPDPFVKLKSGWIVRRLAPDCSRVELASMPKEHDQAKLLHAMGFETANVHLGSGKTAIKMVGQDLDRRKTGWLHDAAEKMVAAVEKDWEAYRKNEK